MRGRAKAAPKKQTAPPKRSGTARSARGRRSTRQQTRPEAVSEEEVRSEDGLHSGQPEQRRFAYPPPRIRGVRVVALEDATVSERLPPLEPETFYSGEERLPLQAVDQITVLRHNVSTLVEAHNHATNVINMLNTRLEGVEELVAELQKDIYSPTDLERFNITSSTSEESGADR